MKRARLFCFLIALVMILTLSSAALAEVYIHPSGAYGFTVPEGWIAVNHDNVAQMVDKGFLGSGTKEALFDQAPGSPTTLLLDGSGDSRSFINNIRVELWDAGGPWSTDEYIPAYREQYDAEAKGMDPDGRIVIPLQAATFGKWETVVYGYIWLRDDGIEFVRMYIEDVTGPMVIELTLDCKLDSASQCVTLLEEVAASFFVP